METKIRISYKGKNQTPTLMIIKEFYNQGIISHATVLYEENSNQPSDIVFDDEIIMVKEYRVERASK